MNDEAEVVIIDTEQTQKELAEAKDKYLRLAADFENYRKRSQKEREALYTDIRAETVSRLLPVIDNLERATHVPCEDKNFFTGIEMTLRACLEVFASLGVTEIDALGKDFDPNLHDAVSHRTDESEDKNKVVEVMQKGYILNGKVLRHAMVGVIN